MKRRLQGLAVGILIGSTFASGFAFAKIGTERIEAVYNNIKLYVDGVKIEPKDAAGTAVEPFIYNGTTYLPVRAVGEAIGKTITWDGATQSVYLGEKPGDKQYLIDMCPPYDYKQCDLYTLSNGKNFLMGGEKYTNGFTINNYSWSCGEIYFNLNAKYKTITLNIGPVDGTDLSITNARGSKGDTVVGFYVDDKLIKDFTLKNGDLPKEVTIPVNYGMKLKITHDVRDGNVGFGNIVAE